MIKYEWIHKAKIDSKLLSEPLEAQVFAIEDRIQISFKDPRDLTFEFIKISRLEKPQTAVIVRLWW